jgi:hypothetical protein
MLELISVAQKEGLTHHLEVMRAIDQQPNQGEQAAGCSAAVYFAGCAIQEVSRGDPGNSIGQNETGRCEDTYY